MTLLLAGACLIALCWPRESSAQAFTLGVRSDYPVGCQPWAVAAGDLNGDGYPDLVVANSCSGTVSVFLGNGAGDFAAAAGSPFTAGVAPGSVAIGDVNGDGNPDLVVGNGGTTFNVTVLLGNGSGGFGAFANVPVGPGSAHAVAIGDLNGDGKLDIVVAMNNTNKVAVVLGNGDGTFGSYTDFPVGSSPESVVIGDLDGDGHPDVAVPNLNDNTVSVLLGDGTGGLAPAAGSPYATGSAPFWIAIGDLNGDGKPDLVTADALSSEVTVLLGDGAGAFSAASGSPFATGSEPLSVAIGDLNGDGRPDLVTANYLGNSVSVLQGDGTGSFGANTDFATGGLGHSVAIGDFNGDGRLDLASANYGDNTISVLLNNNGGSFAAETDYAVGTDPSAIGIGDVTGDARPDIVTANYLSNNVSILHGNSGGGFLAHVDFATSANPMSLTLADPNGDRLLDIVTAGFAAAPYEASVLLNHGAGSFPIHNDYPTGRSADGVALGDVNGDGHLDLVTANATDNTISVIPGDGSGEFGTNTDYATGIDPQAIALADLNGDGKLDAVTANGTSNNVSVLLGNGAGHFPSHVEYATGANAQSVAIGDLNGDGKPDLVVADANPPGSPPGYVSILMGNGNGTFAPKVDLSTIGSRPYSVALADVNGDGHLDIITACMYSDAAYVMLGDGAGGFGPPFGYHAGPGNFIGTQFPLAVAVADLNGDGTADLALADYGSAAVSVLYGLTPTQLQLGLSQSQSLQGAGLTLTGTLTVPHGTGDPTGTVRFFDGFTSLGSVRLIGGVATLPWTPPTLGSHALSAVYGGDGHFFGSSSPTKTESVVATLAAGDPGVPRTLFLAASPNPARGSAALRFGLPHDASVSLRVYDLSGRLVRQLGDSHYSAGEHSLAWDLRDAAGATVPGGMFFVRMNAGGVTRTGRLVVVQ